MDVFPPHLLFTSCLPVYSVISRSSHPAHLEVRSTQGLTHFWAPNHCKCHHLMPPTRYRLLAASPCRLLCHSKAKGCSRFMEDRSWHSSWLLPPNTSPALLCPFTSDTLVYPQAACVLIFCHVLCCPHKHAQLRAQRPTYLDIHTCWITLPCTLIATLADGLWFSWARQKLSFNLPPLCLPDRGCSFLLEET